MLLSRLAGIPMLGSETCSSKALKIASIPLPLAMDFRPANAKCSSCGLRDTTLNISKMSSLYRVRRLRHMCAIFTRNATCTAEATLCACSSAISLGWLGCWAARRTSRPPARLCFRGERHCLLKKQGLFHRGRQHPKSSCSLLRLHAFGELVSHAPYCEQVFRL